MRQRLYDEAQLWLKYSLDVDILAALVLIPRLSPVDIDKPQTTTHDHVLVVELSLLRSPLIARYASLSVAERSPLVLSNS